MSTAPTDEQLTHWGTSLREIDASTLTHEADGAQVRWWLGANGTELFAWSHPGEAPHHLQLVFARVSVEWEREKGLVTGHFQSAGASAGGRYDPYLLSVGGTRDADVCRSALLLLRASAVDRAALAPLLTALETTHVPSPNRAGS